MKFGLGLGLGRKNKAGVSSSATAVDFGALTLAGAGSQTAPVGATSITNAGGTNLVLSAGEVSPNTGGGVTSGTVTFDNGAQWTVTAEANVYSCGTGELAAILALGSATLDGKTIKGRPGADIVSATAGTSIDLAATLAFTTGLTITSHDPLDQCFIRRLGFRHDGPVSFVDVTIRDDFQLSDLFGSGSVMQFKGATGRSGVTMTRVEAYGGDVTTINTTPILTGTAAASASGTTVTFSDSPDLSGVATDRSNMIRVGGSNRVITGVDNTAKTVTISASLTATSEDYTIAHTPQILRIIGQDGGITNAPDLTINDCDFHDYERAMVGTYRAISITENLFDKSYADHVSISVNGSETAFDVSRNKIGRAWGTSSDPLNPHVDGIQINTAPMTVTNTVPYKMTGNYLYGGPDGRARDQQGIFVENGPSATPVLVEIEHNVYLGAARNAITVEQPASDSIIAGNSTLFDNWGGDVSPLTPFIASVSGTYPTQDTGALMMFNVASTVTTANATTVGNYDFGGATADNEGVDYALLFAGAATDFNSDNLASFDALVTALTPDTTTLWPTGRTKRGAISGYYNYTTGVGDEPWREAGWAASGSWTNVTGAATSTTVQSALRQVTGVSATGVSISVSGGTSPSLTLYDTDGTTVIVSGVSDVLATANQYVQVSDTSSASGGTQVDVTIRAGLGATGTFSHTTAAAAYSANATEFTASTDAMSDASLTTSGPAASKKALISFWYLVPSTIPTSGDIFDIRTAGGTPVMTISHASSDNINFNGDVVDNLSSSGALTGLGGTWVHFALSADTTSGVERNQLYINGSANTPAASSMTVDGTLGQVARFYVPDTAPRAQTISYADIYLNFAESLDLSTPANLAKFIDAGKPVDLGTNGTGPTGSSPLGLYTNPFGTFHLDQSGNSNDLTVTGTLSAAATSPSD